MVVAPVPLSIDSVPGTYTLVFTNNSGGGDSEPQTATFEVAIGAIGPKGPWDPKGLPG
jgi:hypothetical protein